MDVIIADVIGEVGLIMIVSTVFGVIAQRCRQPRVIGQILASILLGPTLLGQLPGHLTRHLFPAATMLPVNVLANVAIVIFMFVVRYELDFHALRGHRRAAPMIAAGALLVPMALGIGVVFLFTPGFPHSAGRVTSPGRSCSLWP